MNPVPEKRGVVFRTKGRRPAVCVPHPAAAYGSEKDPSSVRHFRLRTAKTEGGIFYAQTRPAPAFPRGASVYAMCRVAVMAALYLPLARMAIEIGTLKLSFGSLPVTVLAMPAEEAMARVTPRRRTAPLRYSVTELLCQLGALPPRSCATSPGPPCPPSSPWRRAASSPWRSRRYSAVPPWRRWSLPVPSSSTRSRSLLPGAGRPVPDGTAGGRPAVRGDGERKDPGLSAPDPGDLEAGKDRPVPGA